MSVSRKKMRNKWGVYFDLPGFPERRNYALGIALDQIGLINKWVKKIEGWIADENWAELHRKFPDCERIRSFLPAGSGRTMDELFEAMDQDWVRKGCRSLEDLRNKGREIREFFKGMVVSDVLARPELLEQFVAGLRKRGVGPATINRKMAQVRRMFNWAFEKRKIKELPVFPDREIEPPPRQTRYVGDEPERLVAKAPDRLKRLFGLANIMGWRLDEMETLTRSSIDWEGGVINLDGASSKNGQSRQFPLTPEVRALLTEQLAWVDQLQREHAMVIQWLFPNDDPRHKIGDRMRNIRRAMYRACDEAGLNTDPETGLPAKERRWFHDFRRTAQDRMEEHLNDTEVMELVGHKTLSMRKRYRGLFNRKRVVRIGEKLAKGEAAAAAERAGKVVDLVQHVCNSDAVAQNAKPGEAKKPANSRGFGWAGSESNTRHKDFQS